MKNVKLVLAIAGMFVATVACEKSNDSITPASQQDPNAPKGNVRIGITDAPIENNK